MNEECKHEEAYSRWWYEGDTLKGAAGYCRDCGTTWEYNHDTKKLEPNETVSQEVTQGHKE